MSGHLVTIRFAPDGQQVLVPAGTTLLRAAQQVGRDIVATCGARGRCRSCRVKVVSGTAPPAGLADRIQLGEDEVRERYRLACQTAVADDLTVLIAPALEETAFQILAGAGDLRRATGCALDTGVRKIFVRPQPPSQEDHQSSDLEELLREVVQPVTEVPLQVLRTVPSLLRSASDGLTVTLFDQGLLALEPGDTRARAFGVAFDIGTTTVVGYLVDLSGGEVVGTASSLNPQSAFGGDLMSRIAFAQESPSNARQLHARILQLLNGQIEEICAKAGVSRDQVYKVVAVGNTAMHHLFLGIDPTHVGQAPYAPSVRRSLRVTARELGLRVHPNAPVFLLPLVAGFVGADTVGMVLSTRIYESRGTRIAVDIGTNGEVVIGSRQGLTACSAPAGPALEGAQIQCGMRGAHGAIDRVWMDRDVAYHVIGDGPPLGVCGSGLLDAIAGMLDAGVLDASGRLHPEPPGRVTDGLRRRVTALPGGMPAFVLAWGAETAAGKDILLTQADIRQVQLAKGAIKSGIAMLQRLREAPDGRIEELMLAGGFGNYLNIRSAIRIGLIPSLPQDRVSYVGNAAALGAQMALVSETERRRADDLAHQIRHISLADHPDFQDVFLEAVTFPEV
ncbi:MAG: DUF4445 domain-containing protein [candidate division NC10 bacterium]|nr:DUF4445 domain-containing protein [candidate division NC10 bacterium]